MHTRCTQAGNLSCQAGTLLTGAKRPKFTVRSCILTCGAAFPLAVSVTPR